MGRWSTLLLGRAPLSEIPLLSATSVCGKFDAVTKLRPTLRSLYELWEDRQWSVSPIGLDADREDWASSVRGPVKERIGDLVRSFPMTMRLAASPHVSGLGQKILDGMRGIDEA